MEADFWHDRWANGVIGFHQSDINEYLLNYWPKLNLKKGSEVIVPLCGKSSDMLWLREQGHDVLGIELNPTAVQGFFTENNLVATKIEHDCLKGTCCQNIRILEGDFFKLSHEDCKNITAIYDRAALVALPKEMRQKYVKKLFNILPATPPILLIIMEYDQSKIAGPPFSVVESEVNFLYQEHYKIQKMAEKVYQWKGVETIEKVYLLQKK